jgi:hypothetical protein
MFGWSSTSSQLQEGKKTTINRAKNDLNGFMVAAIFIYKSIDFTCSFDYLHGIKDKQEGFGWQA